MLHCVPVYRQDYVEAYVDYLLNKSVAKQFSAFSTGFRTVCGSSVLVCFLNLQQITVY